MSRPEWIPPDIWDAAAKALYGAKPETHLSPDKVPMVLLCATAILEERERWIAIAPQWRRMIHHIEDCPAGMEIDAIVNAVYEGRALPVGPRETIRAQIVHANKHLRKEGRRIVSEKLKDGRHVYRVVTL